MINHSSESDLDEASSDDAPSNRRPRRKSRPKSTPWLPKKTGTDLDLHKQITVAGPGHRTLAVANESDRARLMRALKQIVNQIEAAIEAVD